MEKQETEVIKVVENIHGHQVVDPYRWLESAENPKVRSWIEKQNKATDRALRDEVFGSFSNELIRNFEVVNFSAPVSVSGKYFFRERKPKEDHMAFYVKHGIDARPIKLIDPNDDPKKLMSLEYTACSHSGKYVAYGLAVGGNEMATLRVMDVDTKNDLPDVIPRCRNSNIKWLPGDSGFYYTRNPREGEVPKNEEHLHMKVYLHLLGQSPEKDVCIFGEGRPKDDMISLAISPDGRFLAIGVAQNWTKNDVYIYDRTTKKTSPLVLGVDATFNTIFLHDKVLIETNDNANNGKILSVEYDHLSSPMSEWKEFIPERDVPIRTTDVSKDKLFITYLRNVSSEVVAFDHNGREIGSLPTPQHVTLGHMTTRIHEEEFFYMISSFTFPPKVYRYDPKAKTYLLYRATENPIKEEDYITTQEWCVSKDETRLSMFIVRKKNITLNAKNPTILYGYGGFGNSLTPRFNRNDAPWLKRGGIFVVANIRGGGEFGEKWHKEGIKEKKQNSYDDFIAVAEHLIAKGYTSRQHLGILGGSNGGLLVTVVSVQRPDLFGAVCARVPLTDMVRFPKFGIAVRWIHQYGDPNLSEDLKNILRWSPYHNVKEGMEYPVMLFTTGENDTRVDPLHSRKMVALLQSVNKSNPTYLFTEKDAGHGHGKPISKIVESSALVLTFFSKYLGLRV